MNPRTAVLSDFRPLPLAPFELMMLLDHRPDYPMAFVIACEVSGCLDSARFEQAMRLTAVRHPLLSARLDSIQRYPHWVAAEPAAKLVTWLGNHEAPPVNDVEHGFVALVHPGSGTTQIDFRFHHARCDGVAGCMVIGDVLAFYHALSHGHDPGDLLRDLDSSRLDVRSQLAGKQAPSEMAATNSVPAEARAPFTERWRASLRPVWEAVRFAVQSATAVAPSPQPPGKLAAGDRPLHRLTFDAAESERVTEAAKALEVNQNDLLLSGLFRAIDRWNCDRGAATRGFLRVNMPTNLRSLAHRRMPAANVMSYAFLDRTSAQCRDLPSLARGLRDASRAIVKYDLSRQFLRSLAPVAKFPRLLKLGLDLRSRSCFSTAVLSNVGDPARRFEAQLPRHHEQVIAGDLRVENIFGAPPLRPQTHLGVGATSYRGRLTLAAFVDERALTPKDGDELLARIKHEVLAAGQATATFKAAAEYGC